MGYEEGGQDLPSPFFPLQRWPPSCQPCLSTPWAPNRPPGDYSQEVPRFQADISQKFLVVAVASYLKRLHVIL